MPGVVSILCAPLGYVLVAGFALSRLVAEFSMSSMTWHVWAYLLVVVMASTKAIAAFCHRLPNPVRNNELARKIRREVLQLVADGCTKICPPDTDTQTVHLRIAKASNGNAEVYWVSWDGYPDGPSRKFEIDEEGMVSRLSDDEKWRTANRTHQLERLLTATTLRGGYTARCDVDRARHREDR